MNDTMIRIAGNNNQTLKWVFKMIYTIQQVIHCCCPSILGQRSYGKRSKGEKIYFVNVIVPRMGNSPNK